MKASATSRRRERTALWAMLAAGLLLRLPAITRPPMEFHATRQYHGAKIIRGLALGLAKDSPGRPEWESQVVAEDTPRFIEPPLLELAAAVGWRLAGRELLWLPRLFSAILWTAGGLALFAVARSFLNPAGAFFALGYYLFAPYGVVASRAIQPDPLMVSLLLFSLWAILRYARAPSRRHYLAAVTLTALAILVKPPMAVFAACAVFALVRLHWEGWRSSLGAPANWAFPILVMLPAAAYVFFGFAGDGHLEAQLSAKIMPHLWRTGDYWAGWLRNIQQVVGLAALFAALIGGLAIRSGEGRLFALGWWGGYLLYGLVFSYHIFTHDYYHLPLLPLIGLGLGAWAQMLAERLVAMKRPGWLAPALGLAGAAAVAVLCLKPVRWHYTRPGFEERVRLAQEIGERVGHSPRTLLLAPEYGKPLTFHGGFGGKPWPQGPDLRMEALSGRPPMGVSERFGELSAELNGPPLFFVVTDFEELRGQPELAHFLEENFPVAYRSSRCVIYRLSGGEPEGTGGEPG